MSAGRRGGKRIAPLQSGETRKVRIGCLHDEAALNGKSGKMGVRRKISSRSDVAHQSLQMQKMRRSGLNKLHVRQAQPLGNPPECAFRRHGIGKYFGMGRDANKSQNNHPSQRNPSVSGQTGIPPITCHLMLPGVNIVGIHKKIDVRKDHSRPSFSWKVSTSSASLI